MNGIRIRSMDNDRLSRFLSVWTVNTITMFLESGFTEMMNGMELREWLDSEDWESNKQVDVGDDFIFDSEFNLKGERK